jgi:ABC-type hemin transport system substrate-binding protein
MLFRSFIPITSLLVSRAACSQERIITSGSAITQTVCALGECDQIIASDRTSLYPSHIQQLPSIGYCTRINAEGMISLKPTLVIDENEYVDEAALAQLAGTKNEAGYAQDSDATKPTLGGGGWYTYQPDRTANLMATE